MSYLKAAQTLVCIEIELLQELTRTIRIAFKFFKESKDHLNKNHQRLLGLKQYICPVLSSLDFTDLRQLLKSDQN